MDKEEAINILIANAVCSCIGLCCETDCPFYMQCHTLNFEIELPKAVKRLKEE